MGPAVCGVLMAACSLDSLSREFGSRDGGESSVIDAGDARALGSDAPGTSGFCASQNPAPIFCEDFDEEATLGRWDERTTNNGAGLRVDSTDAFSPSRSLLVAIPATKGSLPLAYVSKRTPGPVSEATLAFEIKTDDLSREPGRAPSCTVSMEDASGIRFAPS